MRFEEKLKRHDKQLLWKEYCGFLDLSLSEYMYIQKRLMNEQIRDWKDSGIGKEILRGSSSAISTIDDFRNCCPLTTYYNYSDILLGQKSEMLPSAPAVWIQTTWEGGIRPVKTAPYTRAMLDVYRKNVLAIMMLSSSKFPGTFDVKRKNRCLYGGAPLPYMTGLIPSLLDEEIDFEWLPDNNENSGLSFGQRIKKGFSMGLHGGIDYFFAVGSVAQYITSNFSKVSGGTGKKPKIGPVMLFRYLKGKYNSKKEGRDLLPRDIFRLKGMVATGTDAKCYKKKLEEAWGVPPIEIAAGTESTCLATETRTDDGMVFFPDACFYEFIPESEMRRSLADENYVPRTCLMDQVEAGYNYELVISVFHGGAFMRYRIGDMYRCVSAGQNTLPRFSFLDRVPGIIDIASFTRITEHSITMVISISKLGIGEWIARKEFDDTQTPFLHLYVELSPKAQQSESVTIRILTEQLSLYFRSFDSDYDDLKKLLGMEPLKITILKYGSIDTFRNNNGKPIERINCSRLDLEEILNMQPDHKRKKE